MVFYSILIFLHVFAAMAMYVAWGVEAVTLRQIARSVAVDDTRMWIRQRAKSGRVARLAMITALVTGVWMMALRWGPQAWPIAAFVALILIIATGVVLERQARPRIAAALHGTDERDADGLSIPVRLLTLSLQLRAAIGIAILALMTVKPGTIGSVAIVTAAVAIAIGHRLMSGSRRRSMTAGGVPSRTRCRQAFIDARI